jgi:ABC-2 type transport system ATP-binding protein
MPHVCRADRPNIESLTMEPVIASTALTKCFGKFKAVDNVSLSVAKGEIYGFLGLNGAGKTTTIRMLLGMIRPTSGQSYLNGTRIHAANRGIWSSVGYLVEVPVSYPELTVAENLEIVRRFRFLSDTNAVATVMEKLHIGQYRDRRAKDLSLGNAQRLGLAKAIMHSPEILILDEPANGLDPAGIVEIRELLSSLAHEQGITIFVSSHILGEISKFATRIGIIHDGALIQELNLDQLEQTRNRRLLIDVRDKNGALSFLAAHGYDAAVAGDGCIEIRDRSTIDHPDKVNGLLVQAGFPPVMLRTDEEDLETYFFRAIGKN